MIKNFNKYVFARNLLIKLLRVKFKITGEDNIPKNKAILFVSNHFNSLETSACVPFIFQKIKQLKHVRFLAKDELFAWQFGNYMRSIKCVSISDPNRDEIIIKDLITKEYNWMIYPEGKIVEDKIIFTTEPASLKDGEKPKVSAKTGAVVLAMKAEMKAENKGEIYICPFTVSYSSMYSRNNKLYLLIEYLTKKNGATKAFNDTQSENDFLFESSLLLHSTMHIEFHKPVCVKDYMEKAATVPDDLKIEYLRHSFTNDLMHTIYKNALLTFQHFFAFYLFSCAENGQLSIKIEEMREFLFNIIATALTSKKDLNIAEDINHFNSLKLISKEEKLKILQDALEEMEIKGLGSVKDGVLYIKDEFLKAQDFAEIRIKNIFKVVFNELSYFKKLTVMLKTIMLKKYEDVRKENGMLAFKLLELDYLKEREGAKSAVRGGTLGLPVLDMKSSVCVLLVHGFRAAPMEMSILQNFLKEDGFSSYSLRLKGHGTTPEEMKKYSKEDFLLSQAFASEACFRIFEKVFVCGFCAGGLLSIINASKFNYAGLITISSPLKMLERKFYLSGIAAKFSLLFKTKDFAIVEADYPEINYQKTYFSSFNELKKIMHLARKSLKNISIPYLIIHGKRDTVSSTKCGEIIYNEVQSKEKELFIIDSGKRHVIVRGEGENALFAKILSFLNAH